MIEAELELWMAEEVAKLGGLFIKLQPRSMRGLPDRIVIWPGTPGGSIHFVELKTEKGKLKPWQERMIGKLRVDYDCNVHVLYGKEQVVEYLRIFDTL